MYVFNDENAALLATDEEVRPSQDESQLSATDEDRADELPEWSRLSATDRQGEAPQWNSMASSQLAMYAIAHNIKTPSLVELQMMLGLGARKHDYRRSRKALGDRKPRQAYTSQQLEKLECEFQDQMEETADHINPGILP
ncbi:hypothetical protein TELCIR_03058 [Teladorsagia circumcincta]|uniref:Homeobox domain protein n=2 Tax=Teladorsagia circumcincta TaxID=45464 RepID=A0A2G9UXF3_TELCI|nr:hypothetical protein TELCIR_03058 [Teladorsagia circumcincta]